MMAMHSLGLLQVLVRQMQPGADHQNAEVRVHAYAYSVFYINGHTTLTQVSLLLVSNLVCLFLLEALLPSPAPLTLLLTQ